MIRTRRIWASNLRLLKAETESPLAQASYRLLRASSSAWKSSVVSHTSLWNLLFSNPGDSYPWQAHVRVNWSDGIFEFQLIRKAGVLVTADRCREPNSVAVLGAFLHQLTAEVPA
ncbi:MAG TPA: hypothetical protein VHX15_06910 [Frankiaceae bacterium]|nr:hypothetical protein [Frankiaceae bacterium]